MLFKLAWGNVRRAGRDYLVYLLTLTLAVTVFYAFNTISVQVDIAGVGAQNIFFAFDYLERERIPVKASDVGGNYSRKIYFDPMTSKVWLKHVKKQPRANDILRKREEEYRAQVREQENKKNDIVWF